MPAEEKALTETVLTGQITTAKAKRSLTEEIKTKDLRAESVANAVALTLRDEITIEEITAEAENAALLETKGKVAKEANVARLVLIGEKAAKDVLLTATDQEEKKASAVALAVTEEKAENADLLAATDAKAVRTVKDAHLKGTG